MDQQRPSVGVGVLIVKDNKVLLGKRKNAHGEGTWCPPGGHLEFGESFEDCARRETLEEAGINIKNIRLITATNDIFSKEKHYITLCFLADYDKGEVTIKEPEKCERWEWFAWDALPTPLFLPIENLIKEGFTLSIQRKDEHPIYQHYKGNLYEVVGLSRHSETLEEMIVYQALYDSPEFGNNALWVRPKSLFFGNVIIDGKEVPRFRLVREKQ